MRNQAGAGRLFRTLLGLSAAILAAAAAIHAAGFSGAAARIESSTMSPFLIGASKALWLLDSTNLLVLATVFLLYVLRPTAANRITIHLLALAPLAAAMLIYANIGLSFIAGHLMLGAALLAIGAAWTLQPERSAHNRT